MNTLPLNNLSNSSRRFILYENYLNHCIQTQATCNGILRLLQDQERNMRLALIGAVNPGLTSEARELISSSTQFNNNPETFIQPINSNTYLNQQRRERNNNVNRNINTNRLELSNLFEVITQELQRSFNENQTEQRTRRTPSIEQIREATTECNFGSITNPINTTCPITSETFQEQTQVLKIDHCGHIFEKQPLLMWFRHNSRCPLCRHSIIPHNNRRNTNDNNTNDNNTNTSQTVNPRNIQIESIVIQPIYEHEIELENDDGDINENISTQTRIQSNVNNSTNTNTNTSNQTNLNHTGHNLNNTSNGNMNNSSNPNLTQLDNNLLYHTMFRTDINPIDLLRNILQSPGVTQTSFNMPNTLNFDLSSNRLD